MNRTPKSGHFRVHFLGYGSVCAKHLSLVESRTIYRPFKQNDFVKSVGGYGIFSEHAINTENFDVDGNGSVNAVFDIPGSRRRVSWISLRREFAALKNLRNTIGLEIAIHVVKAARGINLRLVVNDVVRAGGFSIPGNNRAWVNAFLENAARQAGKTVAYQIPWEKFRASETSERRSGNLSRGLQTDKITGYEINIIGSGTIEMRIVSINCY